MEVFHGFEGGVVRVKAGTCDAILDDAAEVVVLMAINEGVVNANVREATDQQQGVDFEALEQDFKIGAKEGGVAAFADQEIVRAEVHLFCGDGCFPWLQGDSEGSASMEFRARGMIIDPCASVPATKPRSTTARRRLFMVPFG